MQYPFLTQNKLVLIDYVPGSSGQLFLRLWAELDSSMHYKNTELLSKTSMQNSDATYEIDYDIQIPKRIINWFLDKNHPENVDEFAHFFEFLSTTLIAIREPWAANSAIKFYDDKHYEMINKCAIYGIHSFDYDIPVQALRSIGCNIQIIAVVPTTPAGEEYQYNRAMACYPNQVAPWADVITKFNTKAHDRTVDFCSMLAQKDTNAILAWFKNELGPMFNESKVSFVTVLLGLYYAKIVEGLKC
jgi:hypothetical protein